MNYTEASHKEGWTSSINTRNMIMFINPQGNIIKKSHAAGRWRHTPLIPALGRQRQV